MFTIFLKATRAGSLTAWLQSQGLSAAHVAWVAFRMSVIGPIWGVAMAGAALYFLRMNAFKDRDSSVEMIVTVAMPYLVFYSSETAFGDEFQLSGVLAVVAFGLTFASPWGRAYIDPHAEHFLHSFWGSVGHLVNTLIFVISGLTIVLRIEAEQQSISLGDEIGRGLLVYAPASRPDAASCCLPARMSGLLPPPTPPPYSAALLRRSTPQANSAPQLRMPTPHANSTPHLAYTPRVPRRRYAFLTVCRAGLIFAFIPLFRRGLYGFDWRDALVLSWGGLRGAVGLALALAVASDHLITDCNQPRGSHTTHGRRLAAAPSGAALAYNASSGAFYGVQCVEGAETIKSVIMVRACPHPSTCSTPPTISSQSTLFPVRATAI